MRCDFLFEGFASLVVPPIVRGLNSCSGFDLLSFGEFDPLKRLEHVLHRDSVSGVYGVDGRPIARFVRFGRFRVCFVVWFSAFVVSPGMDYALRSTGFPFVFSTLGLVQLVTVETRTLPLADLVWQGSLTAWKGLPPL